MSENEQLEHRIATDETTEQQSIHHATHESANTEIRSNFSPVTFTVLSSYNQPIYLSSALADAALDKTAPYFAADTELYNSDAHEPKYRGHSRRTHDGRISSRSKFHRRHRQRLSSVLRQEH
ncbi:unnamed protein product, partial [Litomosoides sigmodontis]